MLYQVGHAFQQFVDFLLPPRCICCDTVGQLFCTQCQQSILWMKEPVCTCCGRPMHSNKLCNTCKSTPSQNTTIRAATLFEPPIIHAIHQFKYYNAFGLARPFATMMTEAWHIWQRVSTSIDIVTSIPLHKDRIKERGYNQSALLATHFARLNRLPCNNYLMARVRHTPPQAKLNAAERAQNMQNAFSLFRGDVKDKHILLIDDVCTTGATIFSASQVLLAAGARQVSAYCLARAA